MIRRRSILATAALLGAAPHLRAQALAKVHIGQATPAVSFLPILAARALDSFAAAELDLYWAAMPGGDPACARGAGSRRHRPRRGRQRDPAGRDRQGPAFQMVASLMSKVSLDLVVSDQLIKRDRRRPRRRPVATKRLAVLKGAAVGVSAVGGTQDRAARWLARQAGLDPRTDIQVAMAGPPPAIQAALEAGRIDAYVLCPPEGLLAEDARTGQVLVRMGDEFPALNAVPSLVLAVKTPVGPETRALVVATCKALQAASARLLADPAATRRRDPGGAVFRGSRPQVMAAAIESLKSGITARGRFDRGRDRRPARLCRRRGHRARPEGAVLDQRILGRGRPVRALRSVTIAAAARGRHHPGAARPLPRQGARQLRPAGRAAHPGRHRPAERVRPHPRRHPVQGPGADRRPPASGSSAPPTSARTGRWTIPTRTSWSAGGCDILPVEIVVRGYLAGTTGTSILTQYRAGRRDDVRPCASPTACATTSGCRRRSSRPPARRSTAPTTSR